MSALLGRTLQVAGMIILPIGLLVGLTRGDLRFEVRMLAVGGAVYLVGWLIARQVEK